VILGVFFGLGVVCESCEYVGVVIDESCLRG
jgi:hypothetical protein